MSLPSSEEWRPIPGFEGRYEISDQGRIWSIPRKGARGGLLKPRLHRAGYPMVSFFVDGRARPHLVHQLVMVTFVGPRPEGMEVRHLDGDKLNSSLTNLAYGTRTENLLDRIRHGENQLANRTHCRRGHPYDETNIYRIPSRPRARVCRTCTRERGARVFAEKMARRNEVKMRIRGGISPAQQLVDYDWMITTKGVRLHHVTLPRDADEDTIAFGTETLDAACGRPLQSPHIPGVFTRMGAMRCADCCRVRGLPTGKGSPKNDDECRRILGLDK